MDPGSLETNAFEVVAVVLLVLAVAIPKVLEHRRRNGILQTGYASIVIEPSCHREPVEANVPRRLSRVVYQRELSPLGHRLSELVPRRVYPGASHGQLG